MMPVLEWIERNPWLTFFLILATSDGLAKVIRAFTARGCP
jgi:hypothetical protein